MSYTVKFGESISDAVLNSTGDISNWSAILDANFFASWTQGLYSGQTLIIPDSATTNQANIASLLLYPANNRSVPDIYEQIDEIFALLETAIPIETPVQPESVPDTNTYYFVRPLEYISDVILNGTGDIQNWSLVLNANGFKEWVPNLFAGQKIAMPNTVNKNLNNYRALNTYPANNFSVPDIYEQINAIFDNLNDRWILRTGFWMDFNSEWVDSAKWID